jgi:MFS family permease
MGIGTILDNTFSILRERFWAFQGVNILSMLPAYIIYGVILGIMVAVGELNHLDDFTDMLAKNSTSFGFIMLLFLAYLVASFIGMMYLMYGNIVLFSNGLHSQKIPFKEVFKGIRGKRRRFIGMILLMIALCFLLVIIPLVIMSLNILIGIISIILFLLVFFLVIFYFNLAPVVLFLENQGLLVSLRRAFNLMAKHRLRVFGIFILVYLLWSSMFWGFYVLAILAVLFIALKNMVAYIAAGLFAVMALLAFNMLASYIYGPPTAVYYDLLIRKEGYDIQQQLAEENSTAPSLNNERGFSV